MKLQPDRLDGVNAVTRHAPGEVHVGAARFDDSIVVPWRGQVLPWGPARFADLAPAHFTGLLELQPELVIFGSGARLRFPPAACLAGLMARRVGLETMDNAAACRTYNVLASEGRQVVLALLQEAPA